ncbi:MAG: hypothetical protein ACKVP0_16070 [Pirellulaceae bacterium]
MSEPCPPIDVLYALASEDEASQEVRQHVATCDVCQKQLAEIESQTTTMRQVVAAVGPAPPVNSAHPTAIGKYVIVGVIGDDADSVCYRGLHSLLHAEVSILVGKKFKAATPSEQEPLISTARVLLGVEQPNIARVRDVGFLDGAPYIVHDYVTGRRMDKVPADEPLALAAIVRGGNELLAALESLHRRGLPHGQLALRSLVGADDGRLLVVDLGRAWLAPREPIRNDALEAPLILHQLLEHVVPVERKGCWSSLTQVCRQAAATPAPTPAILWQQWRKAGGLASSPMWPLILALTIGGAVMFFFMLIALAFWL